MRDGVILPLSLARESVSSSMDLSNGESDIPLLESLGRQAGHSHTVLSCYSTSALYIFLPMPTQTACCHKSIRRREYPRHRLLPPDHRHRRGIRTGDHMLPLPPSCSNASEFKEALQ